MGSPGPSLYFSVSVNLLNDQSYFTGINEFALDGGNGSRYIQPYVKVCLNHEFLGEQEACLNGVRMTSDLEGPRGYYGAGVDWQATDNLRLYMQAEREHGEHFTREYNVSAGLK